MVLRRVSLVVALCFVLFVGLVPTVACSSSSPSAAYIEAVNAVGRDGHKLVVIEEDVMLFPSNTLHEVSIGAFIHRAAFSPRHTLVEDPDAAEGGMLLCRLPTLNISTTTTSTVGDGATKREHDPPQGEDANRQQQQQSNRGALPSVLQALLLDDKALLSRVAEGIEEEHREGPCFRTRWALGGTGPLLTDEGEHELYELCYDSGFKRVGTPRATAETRDFVDALNTFKQEDEVAQHDADKKKAAAHDDAKASPKPSAAAYRAPEPSEIIFGVRRGSDADAGKATKAFMRQLGRTSRFAEGNGQAGASSFAQHRDVSSDLPFFNVDTGRWELHMGGGDACMRHVDTPPVEVDGSASTARQQTVVPFSTTLFFTCGRQNQLLDTSVYTMSTPRRIVMNRDIGRCTYMVGIESYAVCEWEAHVRAATISPILCNRI